MRFSAILLSAAVLAGCCTENCQRCEVSPNVSVFANSIKRTAKQRKVSFAKAAELLYAEGVRGFDDDYTDPQLAELAATCLKPINLYGFPKFISSGDNARAACDLYVATAVKYGVPRIMCVPEMFTDDTYREDELEKNLSGLKYLTKVATAAGVKVMIEDFGGGEGRNPCSHVRFLTRFLKEIPDLRFALDSGNLYYANRGESVLQMLKIAEGRIEHVHLKDQFHENHHRYATLGLGGVENREVVKTMNRRGFDGWYTLENMVGGDEVEDVVRQISVLRYWLRHE